MRFRDMGRLGWRVSRQENGQRQGEFWRSNHEENHQPGGLMNIFMGLYLQAPANQEQGQ